MTLHSLVYTFISSFMALFPVINPIGSGFIVNGFLKGLDDDERKIIVKKIIINCLFIGIGTLIIGHLILLLFDLAIPIIQLGGGIIICITAIQLLLDSDASSTNETNKMINKINIKDIEKKVFYPISFPITMGSGSISVIFTLMANKAVKEDLITTGIRYGIIVLVIVSMCIILYLFLSQGQKLMKKLGESGNLVINKLVAFFTFCIGIQITVMGISKIFHIDVL